MNLPAEPVADTIKVSRSCTIMKPIDEVYRFWRELSNLPLIMPHLVSVTETSPTRSHWVVKGLIGANLEWDAEIINETCPELIAWQTVDNPEVEHAGTVRFEPTLGGQSTLVRVTLGYHPPGGKMGDVIGKMFGEDPGAMIDEDLQRLKLLLETGRSTLPIET